MVRAVLASDNSFSREKLRQILIAQNVEVVAETCLSCDLADVLRTQGPDFLLADLHTADSNSQELFKRMSTNPNQPLPAFIFTASDETQAARFGDTPGAHCLSAPFTPERLASAIERVTTHTETELQAPQITRDTPAGYSKRIIIRSRGRIVFIPVSSIRWIAAEENYVRISTETETHLLREPISRLEEKLDPQMFRRVHRSSIVNLEYVKEVRTQSNGESVVILFNGQKLAMSRSYRSRMNQWLLDS